MTRIIKKILAIGLVLGVPTGAQAQGANQQAVGTPASAISDAYDCTKVKIKIYEPVEPLTAAERTALMDKAFYESLSRFDRCQAARPSRSGASSGQSAAGAGAGSEAGGGTVQSVASQSSKGTMTEQKTAAEPVQSVASQSVMGTQPKKEPESTVYGQQEPEGSEKLSSLESKDVSTLDNGKLPEDIPPVNNDSVLGKQIRIAAMAEKDPATKAKLWNEYRKYKGLPLVKDFDQNKP